MVKPEADMVQDEHADNIASSGTSAKKVLLIDTNGVPYNAAGGGGSNDGAILDGVSSTIKATVLDYTNSNPLAVRLTDTTGDYVAAGGGGEQYKDNTTVNADYKGTIALGTDGSNYQVLAVDSSGNLQVDVLNSSLAVTGTFWQATQPVSNAGTFAVQATLSAETTKVIGVVRIADGSGNLLTSTSNALDINIKSGSIANTSFTVTQSTGTNLHTVLDSGTLTTITNTVTTSPLPTGKADYDLAFSASVATGAQVGVSIDSDAVTNRAVKEIYVGGNGFGENAVVEFKRGATSIGEIYLISKNFLVKDTLTYATSALTCDITTGNASTMTVYFNVKYYE